MVVQRTTGLAVLDNAVVGARRDTFIPSLTVGPALVYPPLTDRRRPRARGALE